MADHPTVNDLLSNAERLRSERARFRDPLAFAEEMRKRVATRHTDTSYMFSRLGLVVEPEDRALGIDKERPAAKAFHVGACLGFGVVEYCFGRRTDETLNLALERLSITVDHEDQQHENHLLAAEVMDVGVRGFAHSGPYRAVIEEWEDIICPVVDRQLYLKAGFGFVVRMAELAIAAAEEEKAYKQTLEQMALDAERGFTDADFDNFLASLPENPPST
jgi:hypothetical protein